MELGTTWALAWIGECATVARVHRVELITLDQPIGDGDHGENLDRGFTAVAAKLTDAPPASVADVLKLVATTLMSTVGGAAGPLYGTAFLRASKAAAAAQDRAGGLDAVGVGELLAAGLEGVIARGKAAVGDKTMVDAWAPAADAARAVAESGGTAIQAWVAAADAAHTGAVATEPLIARKGRASYLGERAIGHRDPGAQSSALLIDAAARTAIAAASATAAADDAGEVR